MKMKKIERPEIVIEYGNILSLIVAKILCLKVAMRKVKINYVLYDKQYNSHKVAKRTMYIIPKFRFERCNNG